MTLLFHNEVESNSEMKSPIENRSILHSIATVLCSNVSHTLLAEPSFCLLDFGVLEKDSARIE